MKWMILAVLALTACADATPTDEPADPKDECALCGNGRADAHGIERDSYLAYGIVELANTASFDELDIDVGLDMRAARGIVAGRPFDFIEQIDTVPYVGRTAFTALATYAEARGFVPFCGDGDIQSLLEACDDGNRASGDGCSDRCVVESAQPQRRHEDRPELIRGRDINASIVDSNAWYLRERAFKDRGYSSEIVALMERADGIIANQRANDKVGFDELAILSTTPFYDSLLADERATLDEIWALFEVNSAPIITVDSNLRLSLWPQTELTEVGPLVLRPRPIASLSDAGIERLLQRVQQLPRLNLDNDPSTYELADIEGALADYEQVFTPAEIETLSGLIDPLFATTTELAADGSYIATYDEFPHDINASGTYVSFDGYDLRWETRRDLRALTAEGPASATTQPLVSYAMWVERGGERLDCWSFQCRYGYDHDGIKYLRLSDVSDYDRNGYRLVEHWEDGVRVYNRLFYFSNVRGNGTVISDHNASHFMAQSRLTDGTWLSLAKDPAGRPTESISYPNRIDWETEWDYVRTNTAPNNLATTLPETFAAAQHLLPGRYEPHQGYTLEVHTSRTVVLYRTGQTEGRVMRLENGIYRASFGYGTVELNFTNPDEITLQVHDFGNIIVLGDGPGELRRDRSFIVEER